MHNNRIKKEMLMKLYSKLKNTGKKAMLLAAACICLNANILLAEAAEFEVTEAPAVLYTNEHTVLLSDADDSAVVLSGVEANLPIQVTGVTSNGYFQIALDGQTFYVAGIGLSAGTVSDGIYDALIAQQAVFPEGMNWTNDNFYRWKGGIYTGGYGCAGFAFAVSDAAFGEAPAVMHTDYSNVKVGDILRLDNDTHSVIVLEVKADSVVVAEGNYNGSIHWGREIPKSKIMGAGSYIMTRY